MISSHGYIVVGYQGENLSLFSHPKKQDSVWENIVYIAKLELDKTVPLFIIAL